MRHSVVVFPRGKATAARSSFVLPHSPSLPAAGCCRVPQRVWTERCSPTRCWTRHAAATASGWHSIWGDADG